MICSLDLILISSSVQSTYTLSFIKMYFNVVLPSTSRSSRQPFPLRLITGMPTLNVSRFPHAPPISSSM